ncbi:MAG TPA: sugar phosphate isomerase/epimerase [Anaerolineae bacterium]|nr:sugar phosphate isomerase/epimerase [Anaerolineae bacterium]
MRRDEVNSSGSSSPPIVLSSHLLWSLPVAKAAQVASSLDFQGLEIWTEHLWREDHLSELKEQLAQISLRYFLHAPFMDLNPCSRNPRVAQLSLAEQLEALQLARELGIELVVVHPGHCSSSKDSPAEFWPPLLESLEELESEAEKLGITLAVENMEPRPKEFMVRPMDFAWLFQEIPGLNLCLDLAHAAAVGEDALNGFVEQLAGRICHVHLSNVGEGKVHLPLDRGRLPVTPAVSRFLLEFTGAITLEGAAEPAFKTAQLGLARLRKLVKGGDTEDRPKLSSSENPPIEGGTS